MSNSKKLEEQIEVLKMLEALLTMGVSIQEAIIIMSSKFKVQSWDSKLKKGIPLYTILEADNYDKDALLLLKVGLDSEELVVTVRKMIRLLVTKVDKRKELIEIIKYPIMLLVISLLSIGFVTYFLLPQFQRILSTMQVSSMSTNILYKIFSYGPYVLSFIILLFVILFLILSRLSFEKKNKLIFSFPGIRGIYISLYNQLFVLTLANLLKTNLHLSEIVKILENQDENKLLAIEANKIRLGLEVGNTMSRSITSMYYDQQLIEILRIGEESGMLLYYLESYSQIITAVNESRGRRFIFLIQPVFYIIFGILILLLYAAIFIPMFSLMDSI